MEPTARKLSVLRVGGERVLTEPEVLQATKARHWGQGVVVHQTVGSQIEMNLTRS